MTPKTAESFDERPATRGLRRHTAALAIALGVVGGLGAFTFHYGEGLSYFSADPAACMNCHIMTSQFESWQKSSHHTVAACVDCHLPHDLVGKYLAKAGNGYRHSKAFTLQNFHEPIRITEGNSRTLQMNCLGCHGELVHGLAPGPVQLADAVSCVHCHRSVGHGETAGLGGPLRIDEHERTKP